MTNVQLYLTIGIPTLAVLVGMLLNGFLYNALNTGLNSRMGASKLECFHWKPR